MKELSIKFRDREVQNPILRCLIALWAVIMLPIVIVPAMIIFPVALIVTFPLHLLLWSCGRRGFVTRTSDGGLSYSVDLNGFRARTSP